MRIFLLVCLLALTVSGREVDQDDDSKDTSNKKKGKRSFAYGYHQDLGYAGGLPLLPAHHPVHPWVPVARPAVAAVYPQPIAPPVITKQIPVAVHVPVDRHVPVPHPVPVPVFRHVHVPVDRPVPVPVPVDRPVAVPVDRPVPYPVYRHVPVDRPVAVPVPVDRPIVVPVYRQVPVPVDRPYPVPVDRPVDRPIHVPVHVPHPVGFPFAFPQQPAGVPVPIPQQPAGFPVFFSNNKPEEHAPPAATPSESKPAGLEQLGPQRFPQTDEGYDLSPPRQQLLYHPSRLVSHHHHVRPAHLHQVVRHQTTW